MELFAAASTIAPVLEDPRGFAQERAERAWTVLKAPIERRARRAALISLYVFASFLAVCTAFAMNSVSYVLIYHWMMPTRIHSIPLYFDFDPSQDGQRILTSTFGFGCAGCVASSGAHSNTPSSHPLLFLLWHSREADSSELPTAVVNLARFDRQYVEPKKNPVETSPMLYEGQAYDVLVELRMANSERNHAAGSFMVGTELRSGTEGVLASSRRPAGLAHLSVVTRFLHDVVLGAPRWFGFFKDQQVRDSECCIIYERRWFL